MDSTATTGSPPTPPAAPRSAAPWPADDVADNYRYGQVWTVGHPTEVDVLPPVPHLVISSDLYNDSGLGTIMAEVDVHDMRAPELHEPLPGVGTAMLDRLAWYPGSWLREHVGDLPPERHADVARLVRNLIGNP